MTEVTMTASKTFATQSEAWLRNLAIRKRRPAKPATISVFTSYCSKWIVPILGEKEIGEFNNAGLRDFVAHLASKDLRPKTIVEIASCVKAVVASAVNPETGEQIHPRVWNNEFADLACVNPSEQNTPTVNAAQIEAAIKGSEPVYANLYALLGGSGLRIGELLSIKINGTDFDTTFDTTTGAIHVRRSLWRNQIQAPKTPSAVRTVELAPELVALLSDFAASRKSSFLFGNGAPLSESTARMDLQKKKIFGYHSFRRFRATHLRSFGNVPEEIIKSWLGHTNTSDITDRYSQLGKNQEIRRMWANKVGLGFNL